MRIEHLHIYGFGHLTDVVLTFHATGLHVLYGPNEAGKTTILACIRAVLYGFDSTKAKTRYVPTHAGKFGGKILFQTMNARMNGSVTIERIFTGRSLRGEVRVYDGNGNDLTYDMFVQDQLKHLSSHVYQSIYAFGLGELEDFQSLSSQDIQARIHSAGLGLGSVSPVELEKKLENRKLTLYRKRGQDQPLTMLVRKRQELRKSIQQLSILPEHYNQLQQQLKEIKDKIDQLKQQKRELETERDKTLLYVQLRQLWEEIAPLEAILHELPVFPVCTREMLYEWETLQKEQLVLEEQLQKSYERIQSFQQQLLSIPVEDTWIQSWHEIISLNESRQVFKEWENNCKKLENEIQQVSEKLENIVGQLEPADQKGDWQQIQTSFVTYEEIRTYEQNMLALTEQLMGLRGQVEHLQLEIGIVADENRELSEKIQTAAESEEFSGLNVKVPLEQLQQALKQLQAHQAELQQNSLKRALLDERIGQLQQDLNRIQQVTYSRKQKSDSHRNSRYSIAVFVIFLVIAAIAGIMWPFLRTVMIGTIFSTILLGCFLYASVRRKTVEESSSDAFSFEIERIKQELQKEEASQLRLGQEFEKATLKLQTLTAKLGIVMSVQHPQQLQHEIDQLTQYVFQQRMHVERIELLGVQQQDCKRKQGKLEIYLQEARRKLEQVEQQWDDCQLSWKEWLQEHKLPGTLQPVGARQYLQLIERAKECLEMLQGRESQYQYYQKEMEHFILNVHSIQKKLLIDESANNPDIVMCVQKMYERACKNQENYTRMSELEQSLQQASETQKLNEAALQKHMKSLDNWKQSNRLANYEEVSDAYEHTKKMQQLEEQLKLLYLKLEAKLGSRELLNQHLPYILEQDVLTWQRQATEAEQILNQTQWNLEECVRLQGQLESELNLLETKNDQSSLQQQLQSVEDEMKDLAAEWTVLSLIQKFLELARLKYERERQPAVLQRASKMFQVITGDRYSDVRSAIDQQEIRAVTRNQALLPTSYLSRGTAEQLYLTMRFALLDELLEKGMQAPVIMDDVLVNFDPERLQTTIHVLEKMAERHQIVFLTCHPHILHSLQKRVRTCKIIEFSNHQQEFSVQ